MSADDRTEDERRLTRGFLELGREMGWDAAPEHLIRSLPDHAGAAGMLDELLTEDEFLVNADLSGVRVACATTPLRTEAGRTRKRLLSVTPGIDEIRGPERAAALSLAESIHGLTTSRSRFSALAAPYAARWAAVRPSREAAVLGGHEREVDAVCALPLPGRPALVVSASMDVTRVWEPASGRTLRVIPDRGGAAALCPVVVNEADTWLATAGWDGRIGLWEPLTGRRVLETPGHATAVTAICSGRDRNGVPWIAAGGVDGLVRLWDPATLTGSIPLPGHAEKVTGACAVPQRDGSDLLATSSWDGTVRVWDPGSGAQVGVLPGHGERVNSVCLLPMPTGPALLASGSDDGTVRLWDLSRGACVRVLDLHPGSGHRVDAVCALEAGDGSPLVAASYEDQSVRIWSPSSGVVEGHVTGLGGWPRAVCGFSAPDGAVLLAVGTADGTVRIWDRDDLPDTDDAGSGATTGVAAPAGRADRLMVSRDGAPVVEVLDASRGEVAGRFRLPSGPATSLCVLSGSDEQEWLAAASAGGRVGLVEVAGGGSQRVHELPGAPIRAMCRAPRPGAGDLLALATSNGVRVIDPAAGVGGSRAGGGPLGYIRGPATHVCAVVGPDRSTWVAASSGQHFGATVHVWSVRRGVRRPFAVLGRRRARIRVEFPWSVQALVPLQGDNPQVAVVTSEGTCLVWDTATSAVGSRFSVAPPGQGAPSDAIAVPRAGGDLVLTFSGSHGSACLYDPATGRLLTMLRAGGPIHSAASNGRQVFLGLPHGTVAIDLRLGERS